MFGLVWFKYHSKPSKERTARGDQWSGDKSQLEDL